MTFEVHILHAQYLIDSTLYITVFICAECTGDEERPCPAGYTKWPNTNCFKLIKKRLSFGDAISACDHDFPKTSPIWARLAEPRTAEASSLVMHLVVGTHNNLLKSYMYTYVYMHTCTCIDILHEV